MPSSIAGYISKFGYETGPKQKQNTKESKRTEQSGFDSITNRKRSQVVDWGHAVTDLVEMGAVLNSDVVVDRRPPRGG